MNKTILQIKNLNKVYFSKNKDIEALKNLNISIEDKDFISIIGPSGCGKSTILSILADLTQATDGDIIKDKSLTIGYMLQDDSLLSWRTIYENCILGLEIKNLLTKENKDYVTKLLKDYGLYEFKDKFPSSLSGGMRQRVALIRTLALKPDILLLDEPLSALDAHTRMKIGEDIYNIIKKENKTAIMVTHDIGDIICLISKLF